MPGRDLPTSLPGYEVIAAGFKYNMTDMEAALGLPQLPLLEERWAQRERLWFAYNEQLKDCRSILPQTGDPESRHAYHLYTPLLQLEKLSVGRQQIVAAMEAENIGVGIHYEPVHAQPFYRRTLRLPRRRFSQRDLHRRADHLAAAERGHDRERCRRCVRGAWRGFCATTPPSADSIHMGAWQPSPATT